MRSYFLDLAARLDARLRDGEEYQCWLAAESSDFVRFNRSAIRQPGHVRQIYLTLTLLDGSRNASMTMALAGTIEADRFVLDRMIAALRSQLPDLPEDPYLLRATDVQSTEHILPSRLPETAAIVDEVLSAARGLDLVGILAAGPIYRGYANSWGQRNWHETASFNLDWSLYHQRDKAVKASYAGFDWDNGVFAERFAQAAGQLSLLQREPVSIPPGAYRAYMTPSALNEILGMLNWGGVSEKSLRTRQSPLCRMHDDGVRLHPAVTLSEHTAGGLAPAFQGDGFIKPGRVTLFDEGRLAGSLVSPRTAKEYGIAANGADADETMSSLELAAGSLPISRVLAELDTGVFISNLWYLNYSDRMSGRMTGMTRFATFWVEGGEIKAPLNVMRFDDSLFGVLGEKLLALTSEREMLIDTDTYGARSTGSALLPGALVKDFVFVL
ncbi:TldD/PmbA family protein [Noviherbaspirillum denitrificans]|uniref:TldE/PmbA family protein n=1 Tax=Noviherbaspirillum denitrificans TaxID=1968433 RepID=A0A254TBY4_9BURK|nr:metallopeptidase TldD-related protein [Noviherbaspirillum denitrificans]OWW19677.1 TldE/PmbA family protein [Noviherbaspirillum denitrificans]